MPKDITTPPRIFDYCHGCYEEITTGDDFPWCSEACLEEIAADWHKDCNCKKETTNETAGETK